MNITLIHFLIGILGFVLYRKIIISHTRKLLISGSYNNVDLIGPAFNPYLSEGLFIVTLALPLLRFIVPGFFGREVGVNGIQFIISFYVITLQRVLTLIAFFVTIFNNIFGALARLRTFFFFM